MGRKAVKNLAGQIHHVEIYVSDWKKSTAFWTWFLKQLGWEIHEKWNLGRTYKLGGSVIAFVQVKEDFKKPAYHRKRVGMNHIAFYAESKEQVDNIAKALKRKKIPLLYIDRYPKDDWYAIFFEDPDRIKVELVAVK